MQQRYVLFVYGATGVGKSGFAEELASRMPAEIINMDVGQFYVPLTVGTAKPQWRDASVTHHLFDVIDTPRDFTVTEYRAHLQQAVREVWNRGNQPIVVGGSGFYLSSVLFPPRDDSVPVIGSLPVGMDVSWDALNAIDPQRAQELHPNDHYRIERALAIWHSNAGQPSSMKPQYDPLFPWVLIHVDRDRDQLYSRINQRTHEMFAEGFLDEVRSIVGTEWEQFVLRKKLIGYPEVCDYIRNGEQASDLPKVIERMQQLTRHYAKRQGCFWRGLKKRLDKHASGEGRPVFVQEFDLADGDALDHTIKCVLG